MERGAANAWRTHFTRRNSKAYSAEDNTRLIDIVNDKTTYIKAFFTQQTSRKLPVPYEFTFSALKSFFQAARVDDLDRATPPTAFDNLVLIDERQDSIGDPLGTRLWDSAGDPGYLSYPPPGDVKNTGAMRLKEFYETLSGSRILRGADRRTMFFADITPNFALTLAITASSRTIPFLRSFLERYLQFRSGFSAALDSDMGWYFALEFHIPYFALRRGDDHPVHDPRRLKGKPLRTTRPLPLARNQDEDNYYYYEAQISVLVFGVDEWVWSAHCCVDTYHGSEDDKRVYLDPPYSIEPATGGAHPLKRPIWNPREFFLCVLARRMHQALEETRALMDMFGDRMNEYEEEAFVDFYEDPDFTRTRKLTQTVSTLRRFRDSYSRIVNAWERFEEQDVALFELIGLDALRPRWEGYLRKTKRDITELRSFTTLLSQKLDLFNSMRDGVVNASALRESVAATRQGDFIRVLTTMTVCYLPVGLSTAIFSMAMIPDDLAWKWYFTVLVSLCFITAIGASAKPLTRLLHRHILSKLWHIFSSTFSNKARLGFWRS